MSDPQPRDPAHVRTYRDAAACFSMARALWQDCPTKPSPEALQATFATLMIHAKDLRNKAAQGQPPQPRQGGPRAAAPAPSADFPSACPSCNGAVYDNRKDGADKPQWRCKNKECKDAKGYVTSEWSFKKKGQKNTAYAQAHADRPAPTQAQDFEQMPEQLDDEDDLPF